MNETEEGSCSLSLSLSGSYFMAHFSTGARKREEEEELRRGKHETTHSDPDSSFANSRPTAIVCQHSPPLLPRKTHRRDVPARRNIPAAANNAIRDHTYTTSANFQDFFYPLIPTFPTDFTIKSTLFPLPHLLLGDPSTTPTVDVI